MSARSKARKRALDILYEADMRGLDARAVLAAQVQRRADAGDAALNEYATELVEGVVAHAERIDELLSTYSQGWTLDRMPGVDRNLLRLGTYEILFAEDVPVLRGQFGVSRGQQSGKVEERLLRGRSIDVPPSNTRQ